ncbi:MAG: M20 family metallopeptidase [Candidatus Heimdallarchaeota archaeon]
MEVEKVLEKIDVNLIKNLTASLVALDSQNPPGKCSHLASFLKEECQKLGFTTKIFPIDENRHNIMVYYGEGERDIVLSGHLDTVPVGDLNQWKYPPLEVTEKDGKLWGRGTADMLGGVATLIAVMDAIKRSGHKLTHRLVFAGTADEEVGMHGAFHLQKQGVMDKADFLVITEATSLQVGIAEKGPYWIRLHVKGKAAHGSMPEVGINAIEGACLGITAIKEIIPKTTHPLLGVSTVNVGIIQGGTKINVVPEDCSVDLDFRLVPGVDYKVLDGEIKDLLRDLTDKYDYKFSHEIIHTIPALSSDENEPMIKQLLAWSKSIARLPGKPIGLSYGTDAAALIPPKDIPFAIIGGGDPKIIHQANEYVELDELVNAAKIITAAILNTYVKTR